MLLVIAGATGTGKSATALDIAEAIAARGRVPEIVNADALQLYRGMDIGTAKLSTEQRRGVPHHLLDVLDVTENSSVAAYQSDARAAIAAITASGNVPILVGGTGLYIDAVIHRLEFPGTDPQIRRRLEADLARSGPGVLAARLLHVDAPSAASIDSADGRRLVRALEVWELTGRRFSEFTQWANEPWCDYRMVVLDEPQEGLAARLRARANEMWEHGLLEETRNLVGHGLSLAGTAGKAIGYAQALRVVDGTMAEAEAREQTATATIHYARRQRTWFRRYSDAVRLSAKDVDPRAVAACATR